MRLGEIMTSPVETANSDDSAVDAWSKMRSNRIHHLVVVEGRKVIGILSDRDLGGTRSLASRAGRSVGDLMSCPVVTADARTTVREAANKLRGSVIGCLPIMDKEKLVGIVTVSDLLDLIGRGAERPVAKSTRWTMKGRGPRRPKTADRLRKS